MKLIRSCDNHYLIVSDDYIQCNADGSCPSIVEVIDKYKTKGLVLDSTLRIELHNLFHQGLIKEIASFNNVKELPYIIPEEFI